MNKFKLIKNNINSSRLQKATYELRMLDLGLVGPMLEYQDEDLANVGLNNHGIYLDGMRTQFLRKREQQRECDIKAALRIVRRRNQLSESGYKMCEVIAKASAGLMVSTILNTQGECATHLISSEAKDLIAFYNLDILTGEEREKAKKKILSDIIEQRILFDLIDHRGNSISYIINPQSTFDTRIQDALATYGFNTCLDELKYLISYLRVPNMYSPTKLYFESHLENGTVNVYRPYAKGFVEGYNYYEELHDKPALRILKKDSEQ